MAAEKTYWKAELLKKREEWYLKTYQAVQDFGCFKPKPYEDLTINGLTRCLLDFLKFAGHSAQRINGAARVRLEKTKLFGGGIIEKARYQPSAHSTSGYDIEAKINFQTFRIKVEPAASKNKWVPKNDKDTECVCFRGDILIVTGMQMFFEWYIKNNMKQ